MERSFSHTVASLRWSQQEAAWVLVSSCLMSGYDEGSSGIRENDTEWCFNYTLVYKLKLEYLKTIHIVSTAYIIVSTTLHVIPLYPNLLSDSALYTVVPCHIERMYLSSQHKCINQLDRQFYYIAIGWTQTHSQVVTEEWLCYVYQAGLREEYTWRFVQTRLGSGLASARLNMR